MEKCLIQIRLFINVLPDTREAEPTITNQLIGRMKKRKTYYVQVMVEIPTIHPSSRPLYKAGISISFPCSNSTIAIPAIE
jgi:hypothetical protein